MTSKEAYYILIQAWHGNKDTYDYPSFDDINEAFDVLKQALERLEVLEYALKLKQDAIDSLNVANELLSNRVNVLMQENEKLKKAIEILKRKTVNLDILKLCDNVKDYNDFQLSMLSQQEYELLKEVLGNEI